MQSKSLFFFAFCLSNLSSVSQNFPQAYNPQLFTTPLAYTAIYVKQKITIDGSINEAAWQQAKWSENFTDIEGNIKPHPSFDTHMKILWDDSCLYIATHLQEPHLNANLLQHDTIVFQNNDFEIFIDPDKDTHEYFEIEVNALNTIFDLFLTKPYRNGGHAVISYDVPDLKSAVELQGTLNKGMDRDSGWTIEIAIPFRAINFGFKKSYAPVDGSFYRINFSRVEWDWDIINGDYVKRKNSYGQNLPEHNWVWSPQGVINMHFPERWGYLFFSKDSHATYNIPATEEVKNFLWLLYYKQKDFYKKTNQYAINLNELELPSTFQVSQKNYYLSLIGTSLQFVAAITEEGNKQKWTINDEGKVK